MKTAEEYLLEMLLGYNSGSEVYELYGPELIGCMKEYAKQAIEEQLKIAAHEVKIIEVGDYNSEGAGYEYWIADKQSILNCTRIELK